MKPAILIPLLFGTLGVLPPGPPAERVNISKKPFVELVGAGSAQILVRSEGSEAFLGVHVIYPKSGEQVSATFKDGRSGGFSVVRRVGDTKVSTCDNDGDGMPEVRHIFRVLPSGEEQLVRIERLEWTSKVSK